MRQMKEKELSLLSPFSRSHFETWMSRRLPQTRLRRLRFDPALVRPSFPARSSHPRLPSYSVPSSSSGVFFVFCFLCFFFYFFYIIRFSSFLMLPRYLVHPSRSFSVAEATMASANWIHKRGRSRRPGKKYPIVSTAIYIPKHTIIMIHFFSFIYFLFSLFLFFVISRLYRWERRNDEARTAFAVDEDREQSTGADLSIIGTCITMTRLLLLNSPFATRGALAMKIIFCTDISLVSRRTKMKIILRDTLHFCGKISFICIIFCSKVCIVSCSIIRLSAKFPHFFTTQK